MRIGLVGAGAVGQSVGALLVESGWCRELLVASGSEVSACGLVTDLEDLTQITGSPVRVTVAAPQAMGACDALVLSPRARFANTARADVRMAGLAANAPVIAALAREFTGYTGVAVMVTNPVDICARLFAERSGCTRVLGIGSATDTARYRLTLARLLRVPVGAVRGHVIGEHGDAAVICASTTTVHGDPAAVPVQRVRDELAARPRRISDGIGRTRSGPAGAVLAALVHALGLVDGVTELSVRQEEGVYLGVPVQYTAGTPSLCPPPLDPSETAQLNAATEKLHHVYAQLNEEI
ncbi:lactate/malate family dehydrogenase [Streptomyces gardneri]|uniref:L-lactate dehydrogenase n=1 Tax=Streptomyces gardneri TaxID=66892 RepID=A0A4Y3RL22_9ACTN|nr:lactate dehydrogenase [Streptomyces gardneri]GEB57417.1 L-lactate dehydrogenase [Streptomyces gardneri]GHH12733.1 L-lactate dehydrogenase [Streptomyces gardneri]